MTVQAMKAGAVEFLTKPFCDDVLLSAIRHAIDSSRAALGHETEIRALQARYASLSGREREVMALVVSGLLNKDCTIGLTGSTIALVISVASIFAAAGVAYAHGNLKSSLSLRACLRMTLFPSFHSGLRRYINRIVAASST